MPYEINQDKLESPETKTLDLANPPLRQIAFREYPKMLFLHPKDKSKEHLTKIVHSEEEESAAVRQGWRPDGHVPYTNEAELYAEEYEIASEERRGPGRPRKNQETESE